MRAGGWAAGERVDEQRVDVCALMSMQMCVYVNAIRYMLHVLRMSSCMHMQIDYPHGSPRSELRQLLPTDWAVGDQPHSLSARVRVARMAGDADVVVGQIHGDSRSAYDTRSLSLPPCSP